MLYHRSLPKRTCVAIAALAGLLLVACGSGGGGGGGDDGGGGAGGTGSASIFLTDAPGDEFDEILVTITCLAFIGDGPQTEVFRGRETVDLKDLENFSDLFVYAEAVPARRFAKLRMCVDRIELVREVGGVEERIDAEVPANGKIDAIPKDHIDILAGLTLVMEIDMDARRSIIKTGNGRYKFLPVLFLRIAQTRPPGKLARVHGEVTEVFDDESFELCSTMFMASRDVPEPLSS